MTESDALASHELRHQAEFAINVFERLTDYDYSRGLVDTPANISVERLRSKNYLLAHLHSTLLPLLRQQIGDLSDVLRARGSLREKPDLVVTLVLEIQPKLELTLDRIIRVINDVIPGPVLEPKQKEDQHLKQFKCYRIFGLVNSIRKEMQSELASFFVDSRRVLERLTLPVERQVAPQNHPHVALQSIDAAIRWAEGSELPIIHNLWQSNLEEVDGALEDLLVVAHPANKGHTQPTIQLAQSFIPLLRLSKLFFKKMAAERIDRQKGTSFTEMSSHQLTLLDKSVDKITQHLYNLVCELEDNADIGPPHAASLSGHVKSIIYPFHSCLFLADLYVVPISTDTKLGLSLIHFKTWFVTWNTLFFQATHHAIKACEVYRP
ncbi:hypothetical protein PTTG_12626 [Puccinia triticina 1-1 BBBD Race 1]|uniref:Uncharacterized protein n=1 Tax=Puccinia triticina (isolate 1-1 / race 1 (BBBD)) TaxID=630390 RepID=A0A180GSL4_PUCT1|nr:hypothetical protein PTTG_12626 [Puccinia triticina 1-1 BBBD Race 1]